MQILLLWFMMVNKNPNFIKNMDVPSCVDCVHFIKYETREPYNSEFGKCKLFGRKERVSGEIIYDYASICRDKISSDACGPDGKYFEAKNVNSTNKNE